MINQFINVILFVDKRSYNPYNPWEQELEALRERELSSNMKRPREIILDEEDLVESTFKESYICPECGRETKNKKQLYRHAAQVKLLFDKNIYGDFSFIFEFLILSFNRNIPFRFIFHISY